MRWWVITLWGTAAGLLLAAAAWVLLVPAPKAIVVVDGSVYRLDARDPAAAQRAVQVRSQQILEQLVYLDAGSEVLEHSAQELGFTIDEDRGSDLVMKALQAEQERAADNLLSWFNGRLVRRPLAVKVQLEPELNEGEARDALIELKRRVDRAPVDAQLLIDEHRIVRAEWGQRLSVEATLLRLARANVAEGPWVEAAVEDIRPQITENDLAPVDVTKVLATFETSFAGKAGARAINIRRAAKYLDGAVILPGEELSFNSRVGRRVHGRGFVDAPVIINDELEQDVGGGVCQVATTLHGASVYGNLDIVRRRSHSRPSGYAPLGLDATVIDGKVDLRIRNPYEEPILVHTTFPSRYVLRVELLGLNPSVRVEHAYAVTDTENFPRRVWVKPALAPGRFEKKQKGSRGMDVVSVLKIHHEDGQVERRSYRSKYYPVPEVFHVGAEVDLNALPEPPEHAEGLVVDGEERPQAQHGDEDLGLPSPYDVPPLEDSGGTG